MSGDGSTRAERFRRARRDPALAVLEGFHAVKHALRFGADIVEAAARDPAALAALAAELAPELAERFAALPAVSETDLATLTPSPHPTGVIAIARRPVSDAAELFARPAPEPVVLLDRPSRASNVGAVVRVAAAAGVAGVVTLGPLDPWAPAALRGGAGLQFALPVARADSLPDTDRPLVAIDPAGDPHGGEPLPAGALLAFGGERRGLDPAILARAERRLAIPMRPGISSLNLATAVAVVLYA